MPEVADAFRRFAGSYRAAHGAAMLPSHRRAIADIIACRTEALGGQQWCCNDCGALLHVFHSCRNRACPKCHAEQTQAWLEQRREEILPVPYFHVTVTVPEELRAALRRHQTDGYGALMKAAAEAIIVLARDPRWVGGTVRGLALLPTWTQRLPFHTRRPPPPRSFTSCARRGDAPSLPSRRRGAAPPGIPPARPSSSPNRRSPPAPAPASAMPSPGSARTPTCRPMSGRSPGSFTSRHGARDSGPRSTISPATPSASPSPTTASGGRRRDRDLSGQ